MIRSPFVLFVFLSLFSLAQQPTQTIRGRVFDNETKFPLIGAKVVLIPSIQTENKYRALSDFDGDFILNNVPVGKHELQVSYSLYSTNTVTIEVSSAKEVVVNVPLVEFVSEQEEVVVHGRKRGEVLNELALISAQQFSVEETNRYPGSRMDPARMASNFAGVQGADDSRNDIIIRGNSPLGLSLIHISEPTRRP